MAYTQTDLDSIKSAIAAGRKRVRLNGREVEYQSIQQMLIAKTDIEEELNRAAAIAGTAKRRPTAYRARTSKGY